MTDRRAVDNPAVTDTVVIVADSGEKAGFGHISRSSAIAVALRSRGIETGCYAFGAEERFERDGVEWAPLTDGELPAADGDVLLVDSYRFPRDELARAAASTALVVMHDHGAVPEGAALVVSTSASPPAGREEWLIGLEYAALRPVFWGLPRRTLHDSVEHVLVTVGSGLFAEVGSELAAAVAAALPEARVTLVRGPHATNDAPTGIALLDAPDSLLEALLHTDLAVSASGQTMLEAAAGGTPCISFALVDNQRAQVRQLAERDGVLLVDPPDPREIAAAATELARSIDARRELSLNGQRAVDGYGALRVAFHVARLCSKALA
jgi:UDP-2,4-diacetamido-2,4,6-trideoxy-beta-L-altropyranose hydrolase